MNNVIEMRSITKRFGTLVANNNINFELRKGETHALVGENGAGKTTLMKILYGQYTPDEGVILINGKEERCNVAKALKLGIGMVHQNFMQIDRLSITDNIILGHAPRRGILIDHKSAKKEVAALLERFGMKASPDALISSLCVGERQKIEIIKALYLGANILILDEPTAVLTPQEAQELFHIIEDLKREGKSVVFISHKLREVAKVADRVTVMRKGEVVRHFEKDEIQETEIARAMIGKQEVSLIKNRNRGGWGETVLEARNLWIFNDDGAAKIKNMSFQVKSGEILGIGGVEGNGQTELIKGIIGMARVSGGKIFLQSTDVTGKTIEERRNMGIGYISEDRMTTGLALDANMDENVICGKESAPMFSRLGFLKRKEMAGYSAKLAGEFDIRGIRQDKPVKQLSGGNLQKVILAREISRKPDFLIAAQPTRGLDIGAINFVREQLLEQKNQGTAILLVSADLEELMSLSDRMLILYEGEISGEILPEEFLNDSITEEDIGLMMGGVRREERQVN